MTPEGKVKAYFKAECERRGWHVYTLVQLTSKGWPDRGVFGPNGKTAWVELKADGARLSTPTVVRQAAVLAELRRIGHFASFAHGKRGVDLVIRELEEWFT